MVAQQRAGAEAGARGDLVDTQVGVLQQPLGEQAAIMLLGHETFAQYAHLPTGDPTTHAQALYCFGVSTREEVDAVADAALAAGASAADGPEDHGFLYTRSFVDLDGHPWQVMWMDPAAAQRGTQESAASTEEAVA